MLTVFLSGKHKKKRTPFNGGSITGVPYDDGNYDILIETTDVEYRQKIRPETAKAFVQFLDMIEADQKHFAEQPKDSV